MPGGQRRSTDGLEKDSQQKTPPERGCGLYYLLHQASPAHTRRAMEENLIQVFKNKVKLLYSQLKEADAAILGASALAWDDK